MNSIKKNVLVNVLTVQRDEDGKSDIKGEYKGTMYLKGGVYFIFYNEYSEDSELMSECRIKCSDGFVEIKRSGAYSSRLEFEAGRTYKTIYSTPYGGMPVITKTKRVLNALDSDGGKILLEYSMSIGGKNYDNNVVVKIVTA